jgi:hypothetical protein
MRLYENGLAALAPAPCRAEAWRYNLIRKYQSVVSAVSRRE